ncbi:hypothetical protein MtrunA17_Chr2g0333931 [Medicago truncatula]|uniref:Uncharacterized protein n=1 Tax=Medicago truncatula TaxID=3880 RepID=A0A396JEB8_MEDTR|nr:hypothetical protein MtrunA17_Chr2g0333931 [Medicago truncatula]
MIDQINLNHSYTKRLGDKHTRRSQSFFYKASRAVEQLFGKLHQHSASDDTSSSEADIL